MISTLRLWYRQWRHERDVRRIGARLVIVGVIPRESLNYMLARISATKRFSLERSCAVIAASVTLTCAIDRHKRLAIRQQVEARVRAAISSTVDQALNNTRWN